MPKKSAPTPREKARRVTFDRAILQRKLRATLRAEGPILLWSGDGKIPCNHSGLVPETLLDVLKLIEQDKGS